MNEINEPKEYTCRICKEKYISAGVICECCNINLCVVCLCKGCEDDFYSEIQEIKKQKEKYKNLIEKFRWKIYRKYSR